MKIITFTLLITSVFFLSGCSYDRSLLKELNQQGLEFEQALISSETSEQEALALEAIWDWGYPDEEGIKICPDNMQVKITDAAGSGVTSNVLEAEDPVRVIIDIGCSDQPLWYYVITHSPIEKENLLILLNE